VAHVASGPASPLASLPPQAETVPAGPPSLRVGRVFTGNVFSLLVRAFRAGRLSLVSLSTGPQLSAPSPTSSHSSAAELYASGATGPLPPRLHFPSFNSLLKPSPVFNGVKAINAGIKLPGHPSLAFPRPPIKGEHPHQVSPHLSPHLYPSLHA
jgi:hypothetical protein